MPRGAPEFPGPLANTTASISPIDNRTLTQHISNVTSAPALPRLGDLELAVLELLWNDEDATGGREADVHEVHAAIGKRRGISSNTVGSAMERLYKKRLLTRRKVSHAYRYQPAIDRETFRARKVMEAAGGLEALRKRSLLAAFVDLVADSDDDALAELDALVQAKLDQTHDATQTTKAGAKTRRKKGDR